MKESGRTLQRRVALSPRHDGNCHVSRVASWKGNSREISSLCKGTEARRGRVLVGVLGANWRILWEERLTGRQEAD